MESQVEAKTTASDRNNNGQKTAEQLSTESEIRGLQLSRTRIVNDLETATNPHYRKSLEAALAHLDEKIAKLK